MSRLTDIQSVLLTYPTDWTQETNANLLAWLKDNTAVSRDREYTPVGEIISVITESDFKSAADQSWLQFLMQTLQNVGVDTASPFSLKAHFQNGLKDPGLTAFNNLTTETVSRETANNLGSVNEGDIIHVRGL